MNKPKVSVCMLAYNNHQYTKQAIESVLMQVVDFSVELIIGEDASTDSVRDIIRGYATYQSQYITIDCHFNSENVGLIRNFANVVNRCKGEYIAILDNDDYWTDKDKLKRQVDFLDANGEYVICHHPVHLLMDDKIEKDHIRHLPSVTNIKHLAVGNYLRTCSILWRSSASESFPESYYKSTVYDYFYFMLIAKKGLIKRIDNVMAVYRIHNQSDWATQTDQDIKILRYLEIMIGHFEPEIEVILKKRHQSISIRSFLERLNDPEFEDRLKRCILFGTEELQNTLVRSGIGKKKGNLSYYVDRVKSYL